MSALKIGFMGTHCSGKTTLAAALFKHLPNANVNGSVARTSKYPINEDSNLEAQLWIAATRIQREIEQGYGRAKYLICERTVLDDTAYLVRLDNKKIAGDWSDTVKVGSREYSLEEFWAYRDFAMEQARRWMATYDAIFYLAPLPLKIDDKRPGDEEFQKEIDNDIKALITQWGLKPIYIPVASVEDRLKMVESELMDKHLM